MDSLRSRSGSPSTHPRPTRKFNAREDLLLLTERARQWNAVSGTSRYLGAPLFALPEARFTGVCYSPGAGGFKFQKAVAETYFEFLDVRYTPEQRDLTIYVEWYPEVTEPAITKDGEILKNQPSGFYSHSNYKPTGQSYPTKVVMESPRLRDHLGHAAFDLETLKEMYDQPGHPKNRVPSLLSDERGRTIGSQNNPVVHFE